MEQPNDDRLRQLLLLLEWTVCLCSSVLRYGNADSERRMANRADRQSRGKGEQSMKVLVERHAHETEKEIKVQCPRCHSELSVSEEDIFFAKFARIWLTPYTDAIGKERIVEKPNYSDTYECSVFLCPVCNHYIRKERNDLIAIIDERIG